MVGMKLVKRRRGRRLLCPPAAPEPFLVGGQAIVVGRIKGVERPPLAPLIPTEKGSCPSDRLRRQRGRHARPTWCSLPRMGSIYMEHVVGVKNGPGWPS